MTPIPGVLIPQAAQGVADPLAVGRLGTTLRISAVSTGSGALKLTAFVVTELATDTTKRYGLYAGTDADIACPASPCA